MITILRSTHEATDKLRSDALHDLSQIEPEVSFMPFPNSTTLTDAPMWRVRFDLTSDTSIRFGLEINGDVVFGRGSDSANIYDLTPYKADELGVSRHHLTLRPTPTALYVVDEGSTNGTQRNGQALGPSTPYGLNNGDILTLGKLEFVIRITNRPHTGQTGVLQKKADLADALAEVAKAITAQLEPAEVLNRVAEVSMTLTAAGETGIWLIDQATGELRLDAHYGIAEKEIREMRLPSTGDTLAARVVQTGKPIRATREPDQAQIKVKTGFLVEAALFVPIALGGVPFGVLGAVHREAGHSFAERDERLLMAIADFAAIAIQNARLYQSTDQALARRVEELTALNQLSQAMASTLDLDTVFTQMVEKATQRWPVEQTFLWWYDAEQDGYTPYEPGTAQAPLSEAKLGQVEGIAKEAGKQVQPSLVDLSEEAETKTVAVIPLMVKGNRIGVLTLIAKKGTFADADLPRLQTFALPVAMAIENARLFEESEKARVEAEQARTVINAVSRGFPQPLILLDQLGHILIANEAAQSILDKQLSDVLMGISEGIGHLAEMEVGDRTYLTTAEHSENLGTLIVMQDITYVKQIEHDRAEFIRAMTHDLKSPLTAIKGWVELIKMTSQLADQAQEFVDRIIGAADRMLEMINHLLDMAKLTDDQTIQRRVCRLEALAAKAIKDLQGTAESKSMIVEMAVKGESCVINADDVRLYHIALNLVENALKYAPEKSRVDVLVEYAQDAILLKVQDQGPGVPPEELPRIFDPYYRAKHTENITPGIGLGLSTVRSMAKANGGQITAQNLPEKGMEFTLTLPKSLVVGEK